MITFDADYIANTKIKNITNNYKNINNKYKNVEIRIKKERKNWFIHYVFKVMRVKILKKCFYFEVDLVKSKRKKNGYANREFPCKHENFVKFFPFLIFVIKMKI